jgi:YD repeat-containing protein
MKLHSFKICALFLLIGLITGCAKKADDVAVHRVLTITIEEAADTRTATFAYNSAGQCTEAILFTPGRRITYSYSTSQVVAFNYDQSPATPSDTVIYQLNSEGLATSDNLGNTFTYNSDGQLISTTNTSGYSSTNTWSNGNMVASTDNTGGATTTYNWTYYTDKPDTRSIGMEWQGKRSRNLLSGYTLSSTAPGSTTSTHTFVYEFDSEGRVSKMTDTDGNGWNIVYRYTY